MSFRAQVLAAPFKPYDDTLRRTYHPRLCPSIHKEEKGSDDLPSEVAPRPAKAKANPKEFDDPKQASKVRRLADTGAQQETEAIQTCEGEHHAGATLAKVPALFVLTTNAELRDLVQVSYTTYKVEQTPGWRRLLPQKQYAPHQLKMIRQVTESALWGRPFLKVFAAALRSAVRDYKAPHPQVVRTVAAYFKDKLITEGQEVLVAEILHQKGKASDKPAQLRTCLDQKGIVATTVPLTETSTAEGQDASTPEHYFVTVFEVEGGKWLVTPLIDRDVKNLLAKLVVKM